MLLIKGLAIILLIESLATDGILGQQNGEPSNKMITQNDPKLLPEFNEEQQNPLKVQYVNVNGLPVLVQFTYSGPPKILPIATADSYPEGSLINLICTVSGGQRKGLVFSWKLNDQELNEKTLKNSGYFSDDSNVSINSDDADISILKIKNANYSNSGLYTCTARNPLGQDATSVKIVINGS